MRVSICKGELLDQRNTGSYICKRLQDNISGCGTYILCRYDSISAKKLSGELSGIITM